MRLVALVQQNLDSLLLWFRKANSDSDSSMWDNKQGGSSLLLEDFPFALPTQQTHIPCQDDLCTAVPIVIATGSITRSATRNTTDRSETRTHTLSGENPGHLQFAAESGPNSEFNRRLLADRWSLVVLLVFSRFCSEPI